jgi:hypothetical protein
MNKLLTKDNLKKRWQGEDKYIFFEQCSVAFKFMELIC